jgi:DNA-binding transcriptional LysR family regulator
MDIDKLNTFLVCSECKTFFEAADMLYITPPTVTKHIAALEKDLGIRLFDRIGNGIILTADGKQCVPIVKKIVTYSNQLINIGHKTSSQGVSVQTIPLMDRFHINQLMSSFQKQNPLIQLQFSEHQRVLTNIINRQDPIGLVNDIIVDPSVFEMVRFVIGKIGVVVSKEHPLAGCESISLSELADYSFVDIESSGTVSYHQALCQQAGFELNVVRRYPREDSLLFSLIHSHDIALLSSAVYQLYPCNTHFVNLSEGIHSFATFVRLKDTPQSSDVELFWQFIKDYYRRY